VEPEKQQTTCLPTTGGNAVLASFNTVLNFKAIIDRLDFTYADKKPIQVIQQELNLMQGDMPLAKYYDEVEKN